MIDNMGVRVLNVKDGNTFYEYAIHLIDQEIYDCKRLDVDFFIIIHGYGSRGKGGVIKHEIVDYLKKLKNNKVILNFIKGEEWSYSNSVVDEMSKRYPQLILNSNLYNNNSGVSVVWVKK